jgi:hypothetical protein
MVTTYSHIFEGVRDLNTGFGLMTGFIAHLYNSLLHFTNHYMTHYGFSSPSSPLLSQETPSILLSDRDRINLLLAVYRQSVRLGANPLRLTTSNFIFHLNTCGYNPYVTSSLTRGWICCLQLLLVLASAVILESESRGSHDHILPSEIRDSPNLEGQVPVFISPRNRVARLYPQELGSLLGTSYDSQDYGAGIRPLFHRGV